MRILCVYSFGTYVDVDRPLTSWTEIPYGLATIAAELEQVGHDIETWVVSPATPVGEGVGRLLAGFNPGLVCFTAVSSQFPAIVEVAAEFRRQAPGLFQVLGGHHATLSPEHALGGSAVDAICVGEGDRAAVRLAAALAAGEAPRDIPNLWIRDRDGGAVNKTPPEPFLQDLDALPFVNRRHWRRWVNDPDTTSVIVLGRGCPYSCTYCSNHALMKVATGKYVRMRSSANIIAEIRQVAVQYPTVREIYLEIETIGAIPKAAVELAEALAAFNAERAEPLAFGVNLAVTTRLTQDREFAGALLARFRRANIRYVNVGLESGSERVRREILRRPVYTNTDIIDFCRLVKEHGIEINLYAMIGLPGETPAEFRETAELVRTCNPHRTFFGIFYPYPGTDLYRVAAEKGYFKPGGIDWRAERSRAVLDMPGFPRYRIFWYYHLFYFYAYRGNWPLTKIVLYAAWTFVKSHPRLHSLANRAIKGSRILKSLMGRYKAVNAAGA